MIFIVAVSILNIIVCFYFFFFFFFFDFQIRLLVSGMGITDDTRSNSAIGFHNISHLWLTFLQPLLYGDVKIILS